MQNLVIFGETMLELSKRDTTSYNKSFAGDVHSVALYLKRAVPNPDTQAYLLSSIGNDPLSDELVNTLKHQNINTKLLLRHPKRTLGIYMVNTDENGERSFDYWRDHSAAKQTLDLLEESDNQALFELKPNLFFFSGITLAILNNDARKKLWLILKQLKNQGCEIHFDPNYRPRLWANEDEAREHFEKAFSLSSVLLPSLEDIELLYKAESFEHAASILSQFNTDAELVIKDGPNGIFYRDKDHEFIHTVTAVSTVIDTTAAGDSFNGSFLAAKILGKDSQSALSFAANIAAEVIQHRGAVIPLENYNKVANTFLNP